MHNIEAEYIRNNECINKCIPNRTKKQYHQDNRDKIKQHYQDNRDKILAQKNQRHKCLCGCSYTYSHRALHLRTAKHRKLLFEKIGEFVQKYRKIMKV